MTEAGTPLHVKRYAGTRLYHPHAGTYVTIEDLAHWVEHGDDFIVTEVETGEDVTRSVLKHIIIERGRHG